MTADVIISSSTGGLMEISLQKNGRQLKTIRLMIEEWEDLVNQLTQRKIEPIDVVIARYKRLDNAGACCIPISHLLESLRDAKEDPKGVMERERLIL